MVHKFLFVYFFNEQIIVITCHLSLVTIGKSYSAHPRFALYHFYLLNFTTCLFRLSNTWKASSIMCAPRVSRLDKNLFTHFCLIFPTSRFSFEMALTELSYFFKGGKEVLVQYFTKHNSMEGMFMCVESLFTLDRQSGSLFSFKRAKES